jgi:hypothetical protein
VGLDAILVDGALPFFDLRRNGCGDEQRRKPQDSKKFPH